MTDDTSKKFTRIEDVAHHDPIFAALRNERCAYQRFSDALAGLAQAGAFDVDPPSEALVALQLANLVDLEDAEGKASIALMEAERAVLTTMPTTIGGAAALLGFLRQHLGEDPDLPPVIEALGNIEAMLERLSSMPVSAASMNYAAPATSSAPGLLA